MQACKVRRKKSCAATGCIFVCSMIHGLCRGEKMGGCVWLHISNTFFHHHHHQQPLARFVNHCAVKHFIKSNYMFYVCLIWDSSPCLSCKEISVEHFKYIFSPSSSSTTPRPFCYPLCGQTLCEVEFDILFCLFDLGFVTLSVLQRNFH